MPPAAGAIDLEGNIAALPRQLRIGDGVLDQCEVAVGTVEHEGATLTGHGGKTRIALPGFRDPFSACREPMGEPAVK
jgi:hypothetical protein